MPKVAKVLPHGLEHAHYVIDDKYVYGPFKSIFEARDWADTHGLFGKYRHFTLGPLQRIGSPEHADSVGTVV